MPVNLEGSRISATLNAVVFWGVRFSDAAAVDDGVEDTGDKDLQEDNGDLSCRLRSGDVEMLVGDLVRSDTFLELVCEDNVSSVGGSECICDILLLLLLLLLSLSHMSLSIGGVDSLSVAVQLWETESGVCCEVCCWSMRAAMAGGSGDAGDDGRRGYEE